ncbi:hypothetical protein CFOL_v3_19163 [Cephalotus follicularis]|uniref:VLRF1 domain-containing protein n=1 Tax=Cephalotus follicularis TaxID=3775 RepID=A0A1Q3C5Z6_CEPFO|nr:hypothetical protein CFOL_v3_19163 [Cephalotus follicularis]
MMVDQSRCISTTMATTTTINNNNNNNHPHQEKRHRSIFDVEASFFDACRMLSPSATSVSEPSLLIPEDDDSDSRGIDSDTDVKEEKVSQNGLVLPRLTCNTCKVVFESHHDQRSHFKSDIHRFNVKLSIAGKDVVKEEDFDEFTSDCFKDFDVSSISGSDDEGENRLHLRNKGSNIESVKHKLFIRLNTGDRVSILKCMILNDSESVSYESDQASFSPCLSENEVIERLKMLINEPRDNTCLRVVLLASGGHFAGCVLDGNSVVVHKTFHRYVVRAKAGKKQSSKDASGKTAHSAGASLRRYNELALRKEIQELFASWKPYFDASSCIFIHAPSNNRQLLFNGDKPYFSHQRSAIRNVPLTIRRPTLKEARRIYNQMTQVAYEVDEKEIPSGAKEGLMNSTIITHANPASSKEDLITNLDFRDSVENSSSIKKNDELPLSSESESQVIGTFTPLHESAQSGDAQEVLKLLEQGLDPCVKDERGRTPYMLTTEKEVRNTFRRFMASNLDKWDWQAAMVPSALTKELEESQAAKQAEKDAKKKARAKELKKLRKAREKKAQAEAALSQNASTAVENKATPPSYLKGLTQAFGGLCTSKEEEMKRAQAEEREKRAAAAERRLAAAQNTQGNSSNIVPSTLQTKSGTTDINCSCCNASLANKVPFHRYNYKYCSTSCMHVHREMLGDG